MATKATGRKKAVSTLTASNRNAPANPRCKGSDPLASGRWDFVGDVAIGLEIEEIVQEIHARRTYAEGEKGQYRRVEFRGVYAIDVPQGAERKSTGSSPTDESAAP
ncbi:MAG: hypothetical protein WDN28_31715 [Chthoniobacter sp.]